MHLDGYVRVSKVGGRAGNGFISPDVQRDQIRSWAHLRGVEIAAWHTDLDQSGGKLTRPALDVMLERIRTKQTDGVAVARLDRLSRAGVADALTLVEEIHDHGGQLAIVDLGIDPTTTMGEFAMTVLLALARMQRRQITEGWAIATERAVARGVHPHAPFGYRKDTGGILEVDEERAAVVRAAFRFRAAGVAWAAIARELDTLGVPPRRGSHWTGRSVENLIGNRAYLGEARYGTHVNRGAHTPLVSIDEFEAAQIARGVRPARGQPALLSGLVRCAGCRHRMHAATVGSRGQLVYRCKRRYGSGVCPAPASVTRVLLDTHVQREFLAHYGAIAMEGKITNDDLSGARRRLEAAEAEMVAYRDTTTIRDTLGTLGGRHFEDGLQARVQAVVEARDALERARRQAVGVDLGPATVIWPTLTVGERRRLLTEGIDAVFLRRATITGRVTSLDPGRVVVLWRGEAPNDLPGPGLRVELRSFEW